MICCKNIIDVAFFFLIKNYFFPWIQIYHSNDYKRGIILIFIMTSKFLRQDTRKKILIYIIRLSRSLIALCHWHKTPNTICMQILIDWLIAQTDHLWGCTWFRNQHLATWSIKVEHFSCMTFHQLLGTDLFPMTLYRSSQGMLVGDAHLQTLALGSL